MSARQRYLELLRAHQESPDRPGSERYFSPGLECMPREQLRALQGKKLTAAFDYLYEASPYYRAKFMAAGLAPGAIRDVDDLRHVPITRSTDWDADIAAHPPWGTFSPVDDARFAEAGWMVFSTSGTTRRPRVFRHTRHDREMWAWYGARAHYAFGLRPGDRVMNCFFHGPSVAGWASHEAMGRLGCAVIPGGPLSTERRATFVAALRPRALLGTPTALLSLARRLVEDGTDPRSLGVDRLVSAGEPGAAVWTTKQRLETLWGARSHEHFGCTEVAMAPMGYTCEAEVERGEGPVRVHLCEDAFVIEVLDPVTSQPVPFGEPGNLVVSNLYSEAAPFLRFDMGDTVRLTDEPCACGRTHVRAVGGLLGRNDQCLKIKGLKFFPSTFENALRAIDGLGDEYRVEVGTTAHEVDVVRILVERAPGIELVRDAVVAQLRASLGISVEVSLEAPGALPRVGDKGVRFVDRRRG